MLTMTTMNCLDFLITVYSKNLDASLLLVDLVIKLLLLLLLLLLLISDSASK
jgi:hypothetical protein